MSKVHPHAKAALAGLLRNDMMLSAGTFGPGEAPERLLQDSARELRAKVL